MFSLFGHISPAQKQVVLTGHRKTDESKPIQITRRLPNPNISVRGHVLLAILFWSLFFAGVVLNSISYSQTPPVTTQSLVYSDDADIPPLSVIMNVECKESVCGDMLLSVNYSGFPNSACLKPTSTAGVTVYVGSTLQQVQRKILFADNNGSVMDLVMTQNQNRSDSDKIFYVAPLCFTAQESMKLSGADPEATFPLSMIQVGFTNLSGTAGAAMNVEVQWTGIGGTSPSSSSSSTSAKRLINVNEDHSVRVLPIYGTVEEDLDLPAGSRVLSFVPSADVIQFEGFRPSSASKRSDVMIVLQSMTTLRKLERVESLWDLVASVGSTFETLVGVFVVVIPIWVRLFATKSNWISKLLQCGGEERSKSTKSISSEKERSSTTEAEMLDKTCSSDEIDANNINNNNEPKEDSPAIMANAHNDEDDGNAEDDGNSYFQGEDGFYYCYNGAEYFLFSADEGTWIPVQK